MLSSQFRFDFFIFKAYNIPIALIHWSRELKIDQFLYIIIYRSFNAKTNFRQGFLRPIQPYKPARKIRIPMLTFHLNRTPRLRAPINLSTSAGPRQDCPRHFTPAQFAVFPEAAPTLLFNSLKSARGRMAYTPWARTQQQWAARARASRHARTVSIFHGISICMLLRARNKIRARRWGYNPAYNRGMRNRPRGYYCLSFVALEGAHKAARAKRDTMTARDSLLFLAVAARAYI